ncbi:MAG: restriction endonuclease subunit S, partial [Candidatus Thiodiazotropha endolucinida]
TALLASVYQEKMIFDAGGTTIKHIYITRLAKMQVVMPPIGAQSHLVAQLAVVTKRLDSILNKTKSSIQLLKEHRSALITAAVTGQIDVRNLT